MRQEVGPIKVEPSVVEPSVVEQAEAVVEQAVVETSSGGTYIISLYLYSPRKLGVSQCKVVMFYHLAALSYQLCGFASLDVLQRLRCN